MAPRCLWLLLPLLVVGCKEATLGLDGGNDSKDHGLFSQPDGGDVEPFDVFRERPDTGDPEASIFEFADADADIVDQGGPFVCRGPSELPAPACGALSCGNGVVESCQTCSPGCGIVVDAGFRLAFPGDAGCCTETTEACDQADLAGNTCESTGWAWGQLRCSPACSLDPGTCSSCAQGLGSCKEGLLDGRDTVTLDLAARGEQLGIAWATNNHDELQVHLGLLGSTLEPTLTIPCAFGGGFSVALTDLPDGWLVAVREVGGVRLHHLGPRFEALGEVGRFLVGANVAHFIRGPGSSRALVYDGADFTLEGLDATGRARFTTHGFMPGPVIDTEAVGVAALADRWYVSARTNAGIAVAVIDDTGRVLGAPVLPESNVEYPTLAAANGRLVLGWARFDSTLEVVLGELDRDGVLLGAPTVIGDSQDYNRPLLSFDGTTVRVVLQGYTGQTHVAKALSTKTVTLNPVQVSSAQRLVTAPSIRPTRLLDLGTRRFVAWNVVGGPGTGRIGVAELP